MSITRSSRSITLLYCALLITLGLGGAILGPAIPTLALNTGSATDQIAWIFTVKALGGLGGAFGLSRLYDRVPGHRLMAVVTIILLPTLVLTPLIHNLGTLLVVTLIGGACEGILHVGSNTLLVRLHRERVPPYMNGLHFSFGIGATLAPFLLGLSFDLGGGITWPYIGIAGLMIFLIPFFLRFPTPEGESSATVATPAPSPFRKLPLLIVLLFFFYAGIEGSVSGWVYSYALNLNLADKASAAWLTSFFWSGLTAGRLFAVPLSRRFAPRHILLVDLLCGLAIMGWIAFYGWSFTALAVGVIAYGFAIASIFPTTMAFAGSQMPLTGSVTGWFFVGASLGGMTIPWLVGQYFESPGPQAMTIAAGCSILLGLVVYVGIIGASRKVDAPVLRGRKG